jgi:hypothetical protein
VRALGIDYPRLQAINPRLKCTSPSTGPVLAEVVKDVAPMSPGSFIYPFSAYATPKGDRRSGRCRWQCRRYSGRRCQAAHCCCRRMRCRGRSDPCGQRLKLRVVPERIVLRAVLTVPGTERVGRIEEGPDDGPDRRVEMPLAASSNRTDSTTVRRLHWTFSASFNIAWIACDHSLKIAMSRTI